jgi:hypothetical protein
MEKSDLKLEDLDFSDNELTEKERLAVIMLLLRSNGPMSQTELQRQVIALEEMIIETKINVITMRLVFKGLLDVLVKPNGEIAFRATAKGLKAADQLQ